MKAIIYQNAYYSTANTTHQKESVISALEKKNIECKIVSNIAEVLLGHCTANFCIFLDKDYHTARLLEHCGIKVYNSPDAISQTDSKIATYTQCLGIADMPKSALSPLRYTYQPLQDAYLSLIKQDIGYPLVLKADKSSLGKDVFLVENQQELVALDKQYYDKRYILQEYIAQSTGASIRAIVIGGEVICYLKYTNPNDFRSNKELGGKCTTFMPSNAFSLSAQKIASKLGLFYCGIDFFDIPTPKLIEVNSNAYFKGVEQCYNFNLADILIDKIIQDLSGKLDNLKKL